MRMQNEENGAGRHEQCSDLTPLAFYILHSHSNFLNFRGPTPVNPADPSPPLSRPRKHLSGARPGPPPLVPYRLAVHDHRFDSLRVRDGILEARRVADRRVIEEHEVRGQPLL